MDQKEMASMGGKARAEQLSPERKREIARKAVAARIEQMGQTRRKGLEPVTTADVIEAMRPDPCPYGPPVRFTTIRPVMSKDEVLEDFLAKRKAKAQD